MPLQRLVKHKDYESKGTRFMSQPGHRFFRALLQLAVNGKKPRHFPKETIGKFLFKEDWSVGCIEV